jgi:pSer/pThr/pTyr-binding forkhead associated (FHA) protein
MTPAAAPGLSPAGRCPACGTDNPGGMNFCRNCGTSLVGRPPGGGTPVPPAPANQNCPTCGGVTPFGFAFCQQCGNRLSPQTPSARQHGPEAVAATLAASGPGPAPAPLAPHNAPTGYPMAASTGPQAFAPTGPAGDSAPSWGTLISVKRDGSDGPRFPLRGEWAVVGRVGADISFPEDPFLARAHARLQQAPGGGRVTPIDELNGVFRRLAQATPLADGDIVLAGREIMRFELVGAEERAAPPLVRHGVTLFGSPPREPWGRLVQLLPSGGVRDVRHLDEEEIVIGREEGDLVFNDDAFLSRRHAALRWRNGTATIEDLRSSNGTFVRLRAPYDMRTGDHMRMGDQLFRFESA